MSERITEFERQGLVFDVRDEGPLDGEPIVLLHGFPERSTAWHEVVPQLHAEGYRTLAMDQRGYSPRARPKRRRDYVLPELAADVVALIDRLPEGSAHVVGHDFGSAVAWTVAMRHPEKVRTLTAVSVAHPAAFLKSFGYSSQALRSWYMAFFQLPVLPEAVGRRLLDKLMERGGMTPEEAARVRSGIIDDGVLRTALNWYRAIPLADPRSTRRRVTVPTTLVWSDKDFALGPWAPHHTEKWVDAPFCLVVLHDVTHWIPTQAPDELARAILDRVTGNAIAG